MKVNNKLIDDIFDIINSGKSDYVFNDEDKKAFKKVIKQKGYEVEADKSKLDDFKEYIEIMKKRYCQTGNIFNEIDLLDMYFDKAITEIQEQHKKMLKELGLDFFC